MPLCKIFTNLDSSALKDGIETRIANVVANTLNKPLERVTVILVPGARLQRLGTSEPTCVVNISSFEVFSKEQNPTYTGPLMEVFMKEFGLPRERVVLVYHDLDKDMIGW